MDSDPMSHAGDATSGQSHDPELVQPSQPADDIIEEHEDVENSTGVIVFRNQRLALPNESGIQYTPQNISEVRDLVQQEIKKSDARHANMLRAILAIALVATYMAGILLPIITLAYEGKSADPSVEHLVGLVVASIGPILGFYFADKRSN